MQQRSIHPITDMSLKFFAMQRLLKLLAVLAALVAGVQVSHGFALRGPFEPYQVPAIGYRWDTYFSGIPGGVVGYSDDGGPHNLAEEFRRNTPVMYYAFDRNFLEFFGSNGVAAVDQAYMVMNSLTNVSQYSDDLSEFPLTSQRINYQAKNLFMTDLKSMTLHLMVGQMGLDSPDRYTWTLHDRNTTPVPCPAGNSYLVVMRNFDIMTSSLQQQQTSAYVNGTLYTYGIVENCGGALLAYTVPYAVDPLADTWTAVASQAAWIGTAPNVLYDGHNAGGVGLHVGGFYTYLTRDDVGGLRYLLQTNNFNIESSGPDTVQFVTNGAPEILTTQDLGLLIAQSKTNSAAALAALYPGLIVNEIGHDFILVTNVTTQLAVVPAPPFAPVGTFVVQTVSSTNVSILEVFTNTFANIITNFYSPKSRYSIQIISPGNSPFSPAGSPAVLQTNIINGTSRAPAGDFFIIPTNLCAINILKSNLLATVVTNVTPLFTLTNATAGGSNQTFTVDVLTYFTNHVLVYLPITCPADTVALRQGIEQVRFVRRDFDSIVGTFWAPVTNTYRMVELTNNTLRSQQIRRVVNQPDFLFTAADLADGPASTGFPIVDTVLTSFPRYSQVASNGLAGPGTIQSPATFTFNKVGFINESFFDFTLAASSLAFVADQSTAIRGLVWASFDGTTNDPVVYPNGTSLANLVNQFVIQIQPTSLPRGTNGLSYRDVYTNSISGIAYTNTFSVNGGQSPYTWSLAPGSAGLPAGFNLSSTGQFTGTPSGVSRSTTYDFTVRVTDAGARFVDAPLSLTLVP